MTVRTTWLLNPGQTRNDTRLGAVGTFAPLDATQTRAGVVPGGTALNLTGSTMTGTVAIGRAVIQGTATQGAYGFAVTAAETITVANGHASLPRIDTVFAVINDSAYDASGTLLGQIQYVQGTAASSPTAPTSPPNSTAYLRLWDIAVPAGASAGSPINWGTALTDRRVYTAALGGIVPTSDAVAGAYVGQYRDNPSTGALERWSGSAWVSWPAAVGGIVPGTVTTGGYVGQTRYNSTRGMLETWTGSTWVAPGDWTTYTPTWTASPSNPAIGSNGVLEGRYSLIGKTCHVRVSMLAGSSTTFGSGEWKFAVPFTAATSVGSSNFGWTGACHAVRPGFAYNPGMSRILSNTAYLQLLSTTAADGSTNTQWSATAPFTWSSTHYLSASLAYEIA